MRAVAGIYHAGRNSLCQHLGRTRTGVTVFSLGADTVAFIGYSILQKAYQVASNWSVVNGGGTIDAFGEFTAGMTPGNYVDTVEATYGGVSGYATVEVVSPSLDHFTFDEIISPQYVDAPFMVSITARDISGNPLLGYSGTATLSDSTGTINPTTTGRASDRF